MRKYISEFAINMFGEAHAVLQQDGLGSADLRSYFPEEHPCHIYLVCRRPRITIHPDDVKFTDSSCEGIVTIQDGSITHKEPFSIPCRGFAGFQFESSYPFNDFVIRTRVGQIYSSSKTAHFVSMHLGSQFDKYLSLEVLYVGQSYGEDGSRTAPDRLQSHSTLQKIYAEAINRTPDKDIWLMLWSFSPLLIASFDGRPQEYETTSEEDDEHMDQVLGTDITDQQRINFTEAALIRYFQPEYNTMFKGTFPSPVHKTYSECYDLDINSVIVELNTEESNSMIWSPAAEPRWIHFIQYALHSPADRKEMFDFDF